MVCTKVQVLEKEKIKAEWTLQIYNKTTYNYTLLLREFFGISATLRNSNTTLLHENI